MASPTCEVKDGAGAYVATISGNDVTPGNTITIKLTDTSARSWSISCITTDELSVAATVTAALTINTVAQTATFTAPVAGRTYRFKSIVNGGIGPDGVAVASYSTTFCVYTLPAGGVRCIAADETTEGDATFGWISRFNGIARGTVTTSSGGSFQKTLTAAQSYDLVAADYANQSLEFVSNGANVVRLPPATTLTGATGTYFRFVQNVSGGGTIAVKDTNNVAAAATLASGAGAWFRVSVGAVKQITAAFTVA